MFKLGPHLFGDSSNVRSFVEPAPVIPLTEWWVPVLVGIGFILLASYVIWVTLSDRANQPLATIISICLLRIAVVAILFVAFLNLQERRESIEVEPSRLAVIVDTSLSMSLPNESGDSPSRFQVAQGILQNDAIWKQLITKHQVRFFELNDESTLSEIGRLERVESTVKAQSSDESNQIRLGWIMLLVTAAMLAMAGAFRNQNLLSAGLLLVGTVVLIASSVVLTVAFSRSADSPLFHQPAGSPENVLETELESAPQITFAEDYKRLIQRLTELTPAETESRIVGSLKLLLDEAGSDALAGIILLSDGVDTTGENLTGLGGTATAKGTAMIPLGFGSRRLTDNLTLFAVEAPRKVYKRNPFTIRGKVRIRSARPTTSVKLLLTATAPGQSGSPADASQLAEKTINLSSNESQSFAFDFQDRPIGKTTYYVSVEKLESEVDLSDNRAAVSVEVVDKKAKVLLFAGGPSREFRFLRNQLYRDPNVELHVLLQSADSGADQESDELLTAYPTGPEQFNQYDCVVAFDPDWTALSVEQAEMTRRWVANEAGGLIVIAGPVNTPLWTSRPKSDPVSKPIRNLYPVSFYSQSTGSILLGRFGGVDSFPLSFTKAATSFDFLKFAASEAENRELWDQVKVFGYYAVNEAKAGAEIIAHFSDPLTSFGGKFPIYLATHLYGNGRVYFQASGELWRTRGVGPEFFETYYTRLIRWTSQGRLLRGDDPVTLSVDKETCLVGDSVNVRATLQQQNSQLENQKTLTLSLQFPDSPEETGNRSIDLRRIENESDTISFGGRIMVRRPGKHRLQLVTGGLSESKLIGIEFNGKITDVELKNPTRNEEALKILADRSNGKYFDAEDFNSSPTQFKALNELFSDHSHESISSMSNNLDFQRKLLVCLFVWFTVFMATGWLIRRFNRLA